MAHADQAIIACYSQFNNIEFGVRLPMGFGILDLTMPKPERLCK